MNYSQTLQYLYSQLPVYHRIGAAALKPGLDNILRLCDALHQPHKKFKSIHVAGTNGKGSVSHLLASVFMEAGYKVGLYTSPHLKDFRERITVNGKMISKKYVVDFVTTNRKLFETIKPSFFEITVAMAFNYFKDKKVDVAVIETGLGGRLDSTNIITPDLSIITNISYDHTHLLGDTLDKIAFEKAGIIKPQIPIVIGEVANTEVKNVFQKAAQTNKSKLIFAENIASKKYVCPLQGNYQQKNLQTLKASIPPLREQGYNISENHVIKGIKNVIKNTNIRGRWETLSAKPLIICDVAHNAAGIAYVTAQLKKIQYNQLHFIIGMVNDKDITEILKILPRKNTVYYFTQAQIPRALDANELFTQAMQLKLIGKPYKTVREALNAAKSNYRHNDLIFIGGSFFVVAEAL